MYNVRESNVLTGTGTWSGPSRRCGVHDVATRLGVPRRRQRHHHHDRNVCTPKSVRSVDRVPIDRAGHAMSAAATAAELAGWDLQT